MMKFHEQGIQDRRRRFYLPVKKILQEFNVENSSALIDNTQYQTALHYLPPGTVIKPGGSLLLDFGYALHGGIRINNVHSPAVLQVKFGESVSEAIHESNQDSSRKTALLEQPNYGMFEYGNTVFRFVQITNTSEIDFFCQNIMAVALEHDLEVTGSFESSDPRLNAIWRTAVRTVHLCMQDYIYDGAKRDRIVWMGDLHPEIRGILCAFSDTSQVRDSLEYLIRQTPLHKPMNGSFYTYSCWFIISLWDYFLASGDCEFIRSHQDYIRSMMEDFCGFVSEDGSECIPERRFLDWPNEDNAQAKHAGLQALLLWMLRSGEKLYNALGMDAAELIKKQKMLMKHVPDPDNRKAPAALLTLTGLADRRDVLEKEPFDNVSTFYGFYVLLAKDTLPALELIRRYWGAMLDMGATSFWEDFDLKWTENAFGIDELPQAGKADIHADFGNYCYLGLRHSLSHGWSCGPAPFLSERVLGVKFLEPGGRRIAVRPDLGDLEYVRGKVPTPYGMVEVYADNTGKVEVKHPEEVIVER